MTTVPTGEPAPPMRVDHGRIALLAAGKGDSPMINAEEVAG
jgi:hypothetical protein